MAFDTIGLSFAPTNQSTNPQAPSGQVPASPVQSAIRILSLKIPRTANPSGIAPNALLTAPGAASLAGLGTGTDFVNFLRRLLQPQSAQGSDLGAMGFNPRDPMTGTPIANAGSGAGSVLPRVTPGTVPGGLAPTPGWQSPAPPPAPLDGPFIDRTSPGLGNRATVGAGLIRPATFR